MKLKEPLTGKRLVIRNYKKSDLSFLTDMWFDEENGKYMSDPTREYVTDAYQGILDDLENSTDGYYLVAELADGGVPIASAGIFPTGEDTYDIGYCVHKSRWRQGFGSEIVTLLLAWLRQHGAARVMAEVAIDNAPSNRLLQKSDLPLRRKAPSKNTICLCASTAIFTQKRSREALNKSARAGAKDFGLAESSKSGGILDVFPTF